MEDNKFVYPIHGLAYSETNISNFTETNSASEAIDKIHSLNGYIRAGAEETAKHAYGQGYSDGLDDSKSALAWSVFLATGAGICLGVELYKWYRNNHKKNRTKSKEYSEETIEDI